jgi:hypothetical protein
MKNVKEVSIPCEEFREYVHKNVERWHVLHHPLDQIGTVPLEMNKLDHGDSAVLEQLVQKGVQLQGKKEKREHGESRNKIQCAFCVCACMFFMYVCVCVSFPWSK